MNSQPNILLILTDQHAPKIAGFAGNSIVKTQNLDRLAKDSVYFKNASCASPSCTPSRMCLMTAKEPHRCAAWSNHWIIFQSTLHGLDILLITDILRALWARCTLEEKISFTDFNFAPMVIFIMVSPINQIHLPCFLIIVEQRVLV